MHSRERGAAHVHILFFVFTLVLFLGAVGLAYLQMDEVAKRDETVKQLTEDNRTLRADAVIRDHLIDELRPLVADTGTYEGRTGFNYQEALGVVPKPLSNVPSPAKIQERLRNFGGVFNVPDSQRSKLDEVLAYAGTEYQKYVAQVTTLDEARKSALKESETLRAAKDEAVRATQQQVSELADQHSALQTQITTGFSKKDGDLVAAQANITRIREEKNALEAQNTKTVLEMTNVQDTLSAQNDALKNRMKMVNPPQEPDGAVISSSQAAGLAWINLGRKDMLTPGTMFRISSPNSQEIKAYGQVKRIEQDRAEILISGLKDRYLPVVKGDLIANDLYSPNVRRTIVLVGRFSYPWTKPVVTEILRNLGNTVVDKPVPGVDLAIIGSDTVNESGDGFVDISETPEFKAIQFLSIETVTMNKVRDLMKL